MYKKVDTFCANCNSPIVVGYYRYIDERYKHTFCSAKCTGEFQRKRLTVSCSYCGKEVEVCHCWIGTYEKKFCNIGCYGKWRSDNMKGENNPRYTEKQLVACNYCGKTAMVYPCHAVNNYYCDEVCSTKWRIAHFSGEGNPNWQGGFSQYAPGFNGALREEIKKRDNYTCQLCGATEVELAVHHINYDKDNHLPSNLISLCTNTCHSRTNGNREYWMKYFTQVINERQEGATTISKESTVQANGIGSARHLLVKDDDIVCSSWQHEAVSLRRRSESCELR
uniref:Putative HNH endonuclease n=1 Tax=viral metagenome TaxID=1070528 RepID=A0A6M3LWH2_9ZZZZ